MRTFRLAIVVAVLAAFAPAAFAQPRGEDLPRARLLDQQGTKAYTEGRYNDAIRYFNESRRLGGPPFELWNVAKCHLRLDEPEQAAEALEKYLATPNLPPDDQKEASQQLEELKKRPSTITIASTPNGASVTVDGKPLESKTPTSTTVEPGAHTVSVSHPQYATFTKPVEAKYGRAIILDAPLASPIVERRETPPPPPPPPKETEKPFAPDPSRRFAARGDLGVVFPRYGSVGGDAQAGFIASGTYRINEGTPALAIGGLFFVQGDSWKDSANVDAKVPPGCGAALNGPLSATALSLYAIGTAGWDIVPRLRVHGMGGLGAAGYVTSDLGGDVFIPSCTTSPGVRVSFLLGAQLDYAISDMFRITALPLMVQLQPSFSGVNKTPARDASGLWVRATIGLGIGVDL